MKLFVKIDLIQSGLIPFSQITSKSLALGANLVITRAGNKGGVSIRCPLNVQSWNASLPANTHIDFICCHLASDQSGVSKLEKRNADAL